MGDESKMGSCCPLPSCYRYICYITAGVLVLLACCLRTKILCAVKVVKEATHAVSAMKGMLLIPYLKWFLFSIKRPLTRFYNNFRLEMKAEELRREALRAAHMKKVAAFAVEFVAAVDEDGDGGLSLNELKNNEVSGSNEMHKCRNS